MKVLALDLSLTRTGWARSTDVGGFEFGSISPRTRGTPRLQEVLDAVNRLTPGVELVVIEGYSYHSADRGISHAHSTGELGGVIRLYFHQKRIPLVEISPAQVKKLATGAGNAKKAQVLIAAVTRLDYKGHDDNESDALWLLQCALIHHQLPGAVELPKSHLDALAKIEWVRTAA